MRAWVRPLGAIARSVWRVVSAWVRGAEAALVAQIGAQEVTLIAGLALLFYGLAHAFDVPIASITTGALLTALAWPRRAAPAGGPSTSSVDAASPRRRGL